MHRSVKNELNEEKEKNITKRVQAIFSFDKYAASKRKCLVFYSSIITIKSFVGNLFYLGGRFQDGPRKRASERGKGKKTILSWNGSAFSEL